jgi:hypothetical protein
MIDAMTYEGHDDAHNNWYNNRCMTVQQQMHSRHNDGHMIDAMMGAQQTH